MRTSSLKIALASTVLAALISTTPLEAQRRNTPSTPRESQSMRIVRLMREAIARTFGPIAQARPTIPIPIQEEDPIDTTITTTDSPTKTNLVERP